MKKSRHTHHNRVAAMCFSISVSRRTRRPSCCCAVSWLRRCANGWPARVFTQAQAAKRLGVVQPRISEIARNKVDKLSLDYLVGLCAKAGVSVAVKLAA